MSYIILQSGPKELIMIERMIWGLVRNPKENLKKGRKEDLPKQINKLDLLCRLSQY